LGVEIEVNQLVWPILIMGIDTRGLHLRELYLTIILALIMTVLVGCASSQGFDRTAMSDALHVDSIPESQLFASQGIQLFMPLRLGVFFVNRDFPNRQFVRKVEWLTRDRKQLLRQLTPLQNEHILVEAFVLMDTTLRGENIREIRQAGAQYGADVVLIVDGTAAVDRYNNRYALLYPTLLGAYLAPGTESNALVMVTGSLWAVRSEWHTPLQIAEGISKVVGSAVLVEDSTALQEAKERAIDELGMRIIDQLRVQAERLPRARPNSP
jgi:rhombotail lipoprotein